MHPKKVSAGHLLLSTHYLIAYIAVLGIGNNMSWLIISLLLLILISRLSPSPKMFVPVAHYQRPVLPRKYQRFLAFLLTTTCITYILATATPAYAQFFGSAQGFVVSCFPQAASLVSLVFNVLRFLLLIYLGIALAQAVSAIRGGEAVSAVATPPLIIVVVVTAADVAASLIIGGATC